MEGDNEMSTSDSKRVEQNVVQMEFDNRQFEKNVSTTMDSLDKFKKKLDFSNEGKSFGELDKAASKVSFKPLSDAADQIKMKFSALQVAGVTAIANVTNSAVNQAKQLVSRLTTVPVTDGFNEYELTLNAIQTTMAGTGKTAEQVQEQLKKLDKYADDTKYSSADMFSNLPKFTNAGVDLEKAVKAMIGIANATAIAGGSAQQASSAFYNLGQDIGTGYLTRMNYNSITSVAGITTMEWKKQMIDAAIAQKTLTKTGEDAYVANGKTFTLQQLFIDGLQEQWASANVLMKVLGDYGDTTTEIGKKAQAAAQNVTTFSMLMSSLAASVGTGWKDTWQIIFGGLNEATTMWTGVLKFIGGLLDKQTKHRNNFLSEVLDTKYDKFTKQMSEAGISVEDFEKQLKKTAEASGEYDRALSIYSYDDIIKKYGSVAKAFENGAISNELFTKAITSMTSTGVVKQAAADASKFETIVNDVIMGDYGNGKSRIDALTKAGYDYSTVQSLVNQKLAGQKLELKALNDEQLTNLGYTKDQIKVLREIQNSVNSDGLNDQVSSKTLLLDGIKNFATGFVNIATTIKDAWTEVFNPDGVGTAKKMISVFNGLSVQFKKLSERSGEISNTFKGVFSAVHIVYTILKNVYNFIASKLAPLFGVVKIDILSMTSALGAFISKLDTYLSKGNTIKKTGEFWVSTFSNMKKSVSSFTAGLKPANNALIQSSEVITKTFESGKNLSSGYLEMGSSLEKTSANSASAVSSAGNTISSVFTKVSEKTKPAMQSMTASVKTGVDSIGHNMGTVPGKVTEVLNTVGSAIKTAFTNIRKYIAENINYITNFLIATVFIASLVSVLKTMNTLSDALLNFSKAAVNFSNITAPISSLGKCFTEFSKNLKQQRITGYIKDIAIGIAVLVGSVTLLAYMMEKHEKALWGSLGYIAALSAILIVLGVVLGNPKLNFKGDTAFGKSSVTAILSFSAAIMLMSLAIKQFDGLDWKTVVLGAVSICGMLIALGTAMKIAAIDNTKSIKGVFTIISFAGAIYILTKSLEKTANMDIKQIAKGIGTVAVLLGAITLVAKGVNKSSGMAKATLGIAAAVGAVLLMLLAIEKIKDLNPSYSLRILSSLVPVFVAVGAMGLLVGNKEFSKNLSKLGLMAIGITVSVTLLVKMLSTITEIKPSVVNQSLKVLVVFGLILGAIVGLSKLSEHAIKAAVLLVAVSLSMAAMLGIVALLSLMDPKKIMNGVKAISIIGGMLAVLIGVSKLCNAAKGTIISIGVILTILGGVAMAMGLIDAEKAMAGAEAITIMVLGLTTALIALNLIKMDENILRSLGIMALAFIGLGGITLAILALASNIDASIETAASLGILLLLLSGVCLVCSQIGKAGIEAAVVGAIGLGALIVILGVAAIGVASLMYVLGAMVTYIPNFDKFVTLALPLMKTAGVAIGDFIGGIIKGAIVTSSESLPALGSNIAGFINNIGTVDSSVLDSIKSVAAAIVILGSAEMFSAFSQIATLGLGDEIMLSQIKSLGTLLEAFQESVSGLDDSSIDKTVKAAAIAESLGKFVKCMPTEGGLWEGIAGKKDIEKFGSQLTAFGKAMVEFGDSVLDFNDTCVDKVVAAGEVMTTLANKVPNTGGMLGFLMGDNDIGDFGIQLSMFGMYMTSFGENIKTFDDSCVDKVAAAGETMTTLADKVPNTGGILGFLLGDNDIAPFGIQLANFASSMVDLSQILTTGYKTECEDDVASVGRVFQSLGVGLPSFNYAITDTIVYANDYKSFGQMLTNLVDTISKINAEKFKSTTDTITASVYALYTKMILIGSEESKAAATAVSDFVKSLSELAKVKSKDVQKNAENIGSGFLTGVEDGFNNKSDLLFKMMDTVVTKMDIEDQAYQTGMHFVTGFSSGISDNLTLAAKHADELGAESIDALKKVLDIHSPSKRTELIGKFFGSGFFNGVASSKSSIIDYVGKLGGSITSKFTTALKLDPAKIKSSLGLDEIFGGSNPLNSMLNIDELKGLNLDSAINPEDLMNNLNIENEALGQEKLNSEELASIQNERLMAQNDYWSKLLKVKQTGIEAEQYKDMTYLDFQKDTLGKIKEIWDEYDNALNSKRDSIFSEMDLFAEVKKKTEEELAADSEITAGRLTNNLRDQLKEYGSYYETMKSLNGKIQDPKLLALVNSKDMSSITELKALNSMTEEELAEYTQLFNEKLKISAMTSYEQNSELRKTTEGKLSWLMGGVDVSADDFAKMFDGTIASIQQYAVGSIAKMQEIGKNITSGVGQGMVAPNEVMQNSIDGTMGSIVDGLKTAGEIHSPSQLMAREVGTYLTQGTAVGMTDQNALSSISNAITTVINSMGETFNNSTEIMISFGKYIITCMAEGIQSSGGVLANAINSAIDFALGGQSQPTIKPVLDLSNVNRGLKGMSNSYNFGQVSTIASSGAGNRAQSQNGSNQAGGNKTVNYYQTNNSPKALSAAEIYRNTRNGLELARIGGL